jgi:hypothetical protein
VREGDTAAAVVFFAAFKTMTGTATLCLSQYLPVFPWKTLSPQRQLESEMATHPSIQISAEQEANLRKAAAGLINGDSRIGFDMKHFCVDSHGCTLDINDYHCGTVACVAGSFPQFGIQIEDFDTDWDDYLERVTGLHLEGQNFWIFHHKWAALDNTPRGAGKRILWLLEHGVPEDWEDQMLGESLLCYEGK